MTTFTRRAALLAGLLTGLCAAASAAYPDRPVKLVVPYTPGGSADVLSRAIADGLGRRLGQPVIVENKPGANTMLAATAVARSAPDGYTLLLASSSSMVLNPQLYQKISYNATRDFRVVSVAVETPLVIVVGANVPANNLQNFAAYAKAARGKLNYSSVGNGNPLQLATEIMKTELGVELTHVPYNGSAPALQSLLSGEVQLMVDVVSSSLPLIRAGKLRALAVTSAHRLAVLPDVPTVGESGFPNLQVGTWFGIAVPSATPEADGARIQAAMAEVTADSQFRKTFEELGLVMAPPRTAAQVATFLEHERVRWGQVIKANNITLD